ncbi:hypothetical protein [Roseateles sp.]|uniref:hypothetical protein n=1 Tax=Roseateles sp. TaxID=1971397 RepID=UPI0039E90719
MAASGCGGGTAGDTAGPPRAPALQITAAANDSDQVPSGVVHGHRIELRNVGNTSAIAVAVSVSLDAQAQQMPLSCESSNCTRRSDGGIDIAEIPAGGTVTLRQSLRVNPGYRGALRNHWQATAGASSANWRQELTAYVTNLAVTVGEAVSAEGNPLRRSYEVALTNQGPDDAIDVDWDVLTMPGQVWRASSCTASTGASCPADLGEAMKVARLPAGASLRLEVQVDQSAAPVSRVQGVGTRAEAAGDPDPRDNEATRDQDGAFHLFMSDLEGRHYRLTTDAMRTLRATAAGTDYHASIAFDVTGQGLLGVPSDPDPPWQRGSLSVFGPLMVLGLDIRGVRKPYLAPKQLVGQLSELEGHTFNVLGSRADANGTPQDAYTGSARFKDGALQVCLPELPMPFEQCPASRLTRFEASLVGSEIELFARDKVTRVRAARSKDGPVLVSSSRDSATGASEFWIALPNAAHNPFSLIESSLHEATFESQSGNATAMLGSLDRDNNANPRLVAVRGLPIVVLQRLNTAGVLGICGLSSQLASSGQPGLFQGGLRGDWLTGAYENGEFVKERPCFSGTVHHTQTGSFAVFLGVKGGDLPGRWMFAGRL